MRTKSTTSTSEHSDPITLEALSYYMYNLSDWSITDHTKVGTHIFHGQTQECIVHTRELVHSQPMLRIAIQTQFSLTGMIDQEYLAIPAIVSDDDPIDTSLATLDDIYFVCPDSIIVSHEELEKLLQKHLECSLG